MMMLFTCIFGPSISLVLKFALVSGSDMATTTALKSPDNEDFYAILGKSFKHNVYSFHILGVAKNSSEQEIKNA